MAFLGEDKKTNALLVAGGVAALAGVAYYAYQNNLLGNFFKPNEQVPASSGTTVPDDDEVPNTTTTPTPAVPVIPGQPIYYPPVPPAPPAPYQYPYDYIFNPVITDHYNDVSSPITNPIQAIIERGIGTQDTHVDIEDDKDTNTNKSKKLSSTCKKCYNRCKNAKKSRYKECQKCGAACGFKVKLSKNKVKVTKSSNLVLALEGIAYTPYPNTRVYDQGFIVRDFGY